MLFADYSDPDVVRVGDTWYLTASSFSNLPGLPILASRDLVHWDIVGNALPRLDSGSRFDTPRRGGGVWAPSLRHEGGVFSLYYPDPDRGIFRIDALNAAGPWSEPFLVDDAPGSIDPCPFTDTDGTRWLIKGWAKSRSGINNRLTLHRLAGGKVADAGRTLIDGNQLPPVETSAGLLPWITIEGPKLYRVAGWYYVFAPAGGVKVGWQAVFRAASLEGPWEVRNVLDQGSTPVNGPHQGALVDGPDGRWWFLHFQDLDSWGRVVHLQPVTWQDGWPQIGTGGPRGEPVTEAKLPYPREHLALGSTDADLGGLLWQWQAQSKPDWAVRYNGRLRLACVSQSAHPWENPALLTRKLEGPACVLTVHVALSARADGEEAGLAAVGRRSVSLAVQQASPARVVLREWDALSGRPVREASVGVASTAVWLRLRFVPSVVPGGHEHSAWPAMQYELLAETTAWWSDDGRDWKPLGDAVLVPPGRWVGAQTGVYALAPSGTPSFVANQNGFAEFSEAQWKVGEAADV